MTNKGRLFLIPHVIDDLVSDAFIPDYTRQQVHDISCFIMENEKAGRALIKRLKIKTAQADIAVMLWNEHTDKKDLPQLLVPLLNGKDIGLMSDAGIPCVADPGYEIVLAAHQKGVQVIPLPGSSSLMMALMASGLGGQFFAFNGYIPIEKPLRLKKLKEMESMAKKTGQTQIFIEVPYRNNQLFSEILSACSGDTKLTVAADISGANEFILTQSVANWKQKEAPGLHKRPCVFIIR